MCMVKVRNEINTEQDVQNLITAIILRQKGKYTKKYLIKATKHYLPDPQIKTVVNDKKIKGMIDNTLATFHRIGKIKNFENIYYPTGLNECIRKENKVSMVKKMPAF